MDHTYDTRSKAGLQPAPKQATLGASATYFYSEEESIVFEEADLVSLLSTPDILPGTKTSGLVNLPPFGENEQDSVIPEFDQKSVPQDPDMNFAHVSLK